VGSGETFRFVDCGAQDPFESNARMPVLGRNVGEGKGAIMTTSVWGSTHLNVGWFDDVDSTLDLDRCAALGIQVIRRPVYGGGTAFYEAGSAVMWSWLLPKDQHPDLDAELARFQPITMDALQRLGLDGVVFEGSSDLRFNGRKLGALTGQDVVLCNSVGGFINNRPPDLDTYLQVVRVPDDKFKDKAVKDMREYVVTAEEIRGKALPYEEFRDALLAATEAAGLELRHEPMNEAELRGMEKIARKVGSDEFVRRISSDRFRAQAPDGTRVGFGNEKGRKLCRAGVAVDTEDRVVAAMMAGDMHVGPPDILDRTAAALVGADSTDEGDLRTRIAAVFEAGDVHQPDALMGVTTDDLLKAVQKAVANSEAR
jgi:lipoate-protein ligase A